MPHGTAMHRLRKRVMFSLAQELHLDQCIVCKRMIEDADDLSIEHIQPWEGRDTSLFWDITNIAFSHRWCNQPHTRPGKPPVHDLKPDMWWCSHCEQELPLDRFGLKTVTSGAKRPRNYCNKCRTERKAMGLSA